MTAKHKCPCCGYLTLKERGVFDICPVCFWEDDDEAEIYRQSAPERPRGPNYVHLWQARENFIKFGASEERCKPFIRPPRPEEIP